MSKLDSFIRRMLAQRDCLNFGARAVAGIPGPVLELGLGNGRTYDHLREILPERDIYVFDRVVNSFPSCTPPADRLFLGEITMTLAHAAETISNTAVLAHSDLGTSDVRKNVEIAARVAPLLDALMTRNGIVLSNTPMDVDRWTPVPEPPGVKSGRYYLYRVGGEK